MSFNEQVQSLSVGGGKRSVFKDGVKSKMLTGDQPILFRIQPAFNPDDRDNSGNVNPTGWLRCRDAQGSLTNWGAIIRMCRFVGHGTGKTGNRRDFLSPLTWGSRDEVTCPLSTLYATAANYPEWQYLLEDRRDANNRLIDRAALSQPSEFLVINIVELSGGAMPENVLGIMTKSSTDSLVSPKKNGLLFWRANNVTAEMIQADPLCAWAVGDITDPTNGPVLFTAKEQDKGAYSGYVVGLATDPNNQVRRYPLDGTLLAQRYDLTDVRNVLDIKSEQETIDALVQVFNGRGPHGHHELELLKLAFGGMYKVPEPPAAMAASPTIPASGLNNENLGSGFGNNPAGAPKTSGFPAPPTGAAAAPVAPPPALTPAAPTSAPVAPPPALTPAAPTSAPVAPPPAPTPAAAPTAPTTAPGMGATEQNAASESTIQAPQQPQAPGDPVSGWAGREAFLAELRSQSGNA